MSNLFINKDEIVKITVWSGYDNNGKSRYWSREEDKPKGVSSVEEHIVNFRRPNFKDTTELMDIGVRLNAEGGMDMAFAEIRYRRMEMLLRSWNLKDDNGKEVPANPNSIANLHPTFAMVLSATLERELGIADPYGEENAKEWQDPDALESA